MEQKIGELLTIDEMAARLKVAKIWIYKRTMKGRNMIPFKRFGGHLRFVEADVMEYFAKQQADL